MQGVIFQRGRMKIQLLFSCFVFLVSCSSTKVAHHESICLDSEEAARTLGQQVFDAGFNSRVSYWVTGDPTKPIRGLGLMYGGFDPKPYCPDGGYPVVVIFESEGTEHDIDKVMSWSRTVLRSMAREQRDGI